MRQREFQKPRRSSLADPVTIFFLFVYVQIAGPVTRYQKMGVWHGNGPGNLAENVELFTWYLGSGDESDIFEDCQ